MSSLFTYKLYNRPLRNWPLNVTCEAVSWEGYVSPFGFTTKNFIKTTAKHHTFVHGQSHHPKHVYKSIVLSESMRLRRLCEESSNYFEGLDQLACKCSKSHFSKKLYHSIISNAKTWTDRFNPINRKEPTNGNKNDKRIAWPTAFPDVIKLTNKEKKLQPNAFVSYRRPATLGKILTNYLKLAWQLIEEVGISGPCGKCVLCGNHASIVPVIHEINVFSHVVKLRQDLNCNSFGIYVAICKVCDCKYVGQTKNNFSTLWRAHRYLG